VADIPNNFLLRKKKTADMKLLRRTAGFPSLVRGRNGDILEELDMDPIKYKSA
jgi:hypothetical protein